MNTIQRIKAGKIHTQADIVFCLDATASMAPCIEGVKMGLKQFATGLQSAASVDYRLRLIAYRDLHDPTCTVDWDVFEFTSDLDEFGSWLAGVRAHCNQEKRGAESSLDALYLAIHSDWRTDKTQRTIVLLTDDNTHPTLHNRTYSRPDNDVYRVIHDFQVMPPAILFMVAPKYDLYSKIEQSVKAADHQVVATWVPQDDERYEGLNSVSWEPLMRVLGETVSSASISACGDEQCESHG